jgi:hypothetical protein
MTARTRLLNYLFLLLWGLPLGVLVTYFGLNYSGFCFAKMRYLTNDEKIRIVFDYQNNREEIPIETERKGTQYYSQIPYNTFEEFIVNNPDCCQVNPGGGYDLPPPDFLDRITGYNAGDAIVLNYKIRYLDDNGRPRSTTMKLESALQNCGKAKW